MGLFNMAYCRSPSDGDIYLVGEYGYITCYCDNDEGYPSFYRFSEAIDHLIAHKRKGHKVPETAFHNLIRDMYRFNDTVPNEW